MKVVGILGSPRKAGNSTFLAEIISNKAKQTGAEVSNYYLNELLYSGCQACGGCKGRSEQCILEDDLAEVLSSIVDADLVIWATPVYWGEVSGQMKMFLDRTYSFLKPGFQDRPDKHRLAPGKTLVWIQAQGASDKTLFGDIFTRYNSFFSQLKFFDKQHVLIARGVSQAGEVINCPEILAEAARLCDSLFAV